MAHTRRRIGIPRPNCLSAKKIYWKNSKKDRKNDVLRRNTKIKVYSLLLMKKLKLEVKGSGMLSRFLKMFWQLGLM